MNDYNQIRSFNVGIAQETSIEAAMIYDDLAYAQKIFGKGYFFHSYQQMLQRFPFLSERTIRRHVKLLVNKGWISTKIKKVNGSPTCHYRIEKTLTAKLAETMETETDKLAETMETDKLAETYNIATKETTKTLLSKDNSKEKIKDFSFGVTKEKKEKKSKDSFENREILEIYGDLQSAKADCPPQFRDTPPASSTDTEPQTTSKKPKAKAKPEADDPKDEIKKQFYRVIKQYQLPVVNHKHINGWCDKLRTGLGANTAVHYLVRLQERDLRKEGAVEKFVPVLSRPLDILEKSGKIIAYYTRTKGKVIASVEVEDPIIAAGDGTFPAVWPKGKAEWNKEYEEPGGREIRYFRGVVLDNTTIGEYCRIMEAREQLRNEGNQDGAE